MKKRRGKKARSRRNRKRNPRGNIRKEKVKGNRQNIREDGYPWACEMLINAQRLGVKMSSVEIETIKSNTSRAQLFQRFFRIT